MRKTSIPDLTFPTVNYGRRATPWDLRPLLYKGGAGANTRVVAKLVDSGILGRPIPSRIEIVTNIHAALTARLVAGGSTRTLSNAIRHLRTFWIWADQSIKDRPLSLESIETSYRHWTEYLLNSNRLKLITAESAYDYANVVSTVLNETLDRGTPLIETTRIRRPRDRSNTISSAADKQNLSDTFTFGHLLLDIVNGLSGQAIWGPLPIKIHLRSGRILEEWSGQRPAEDLLMLKPEYKLKGQANRLISQRKDYENERTLRTRHPIANFRLEAELLIFIAQTGMNLAQAHRLMLNHFSYKSTIDGYEIRSYKERKQGAVLFEIFEGYRPIFERYLKWRKSVFPNSHELFPFVRTNGRTIETPPPLTKFRKCICPKLGIPFIPPQELRKTRINWLLRKSRDPDLTAEQAQHTKETLLRVYEQPSLQVAMAEIVQFWPEFDPALLYNAKPCPAPGVCDGTPQPLSDLPLEAPKPDCRTPAGCLFCAHHRDIDSQDYVWSVASMRHLKTVVIQNFRPLQKGKADAARHVELAIDALTAKLKWFKDSNERRKNWVHEALERIEESEFHPHWNYLIESALGV